MPTHTFFLLSKFQGSNLHKFSLQGLMKNVTMLVMGPMLGFKLAVICLCKASVRSQKTEFYVAKKL